MFTKICTVLIFPAALCFQIAAMDNIPGTKTSQQLPDELWHKITSDSISPSDINRLDREILHINNLRSTCRTLLSTLSDFHISEIFKERCDKHPLKMLMIKLLGVVPAGSDNFYGLHLQKKDKKDREYKVDKNRLKVVYKTLLSYVLLNPHLKARRALRESIYLYQNTKCSGCNDKELLEESGESFPFLQCASLGDDVIKIKHRRGKNNYSKAYFHADRSRSSRDLILESMQHHEIGFLTINQAGNPYHMGTCRRGIYLAQEKGFCTFIPMKAQAKHPLEVQCLGLLALEDNNILIGYQTKPFSALRKPNTLHVARFTSDGKVDPSFGKNGQMEKTLEIAFDRAMLAMNMKGTIIIGDPMTQEIYWQIIPAEYESPEIISGTENTSDDNQNYMLPYLFGDGENIE